MQIPPHWNMTEIILVLTMLASVGIVLALMLFGVWLKKPAPDARGDMEEHR